MPRSPKQMGRQGTAIILGIVVIGILLGYVLPIGIGAVTNPTEEVTFTQDVNTDVDINPLIVSNVTEVNDGVNATVELTDSDTQSTTTATIDQGSTQTLTLEGNDIDVTVDDTTATSATLTYVIPSDYGWDSGSQSLFGLIPLFLVLVAVIAVIGFAMDAF